MRWLQALLGAVILLIAAALADLLLGVGWLARQALISIGAEYPLNLESQVPWYGIIILCIGISGCLTYAFASIATAIREAFRRRR